MYIVAGPPGSGKSRAFPVSDYGVDFFNADDRASTLNGGSYQGISLEIRSQVSRELEAFIEGHIERSKSFAARYPRPQPGKPATRNSRMRHLRRRIGDLRQYGFQ
jgi:hypothetical protein